MILKALCLVAAIINSQTIEEIARLEQALKFGQVPAGLIVPDPASGVNDGSGPMELSALVWLTVLFLASIFCFMDHIPQCFAATVKRLRIENVAVALLQSVVVAAGILTEIISDKLHGHVRFLSLP
ncbi:hypothetical protein Bca52824_079330 [Brassica carinata]|uniref:Uncharacterized protein n=1 Tax=Brassica carinata TaxID=52824 RepID=A0A8X7PXT8_BRACI|nr:hypothetical protein Bca52824_079330 [Brassica carinata]